MLWVRLPCPIHHQPSCRAGRFGTFPVHLRQERRCGNCSDSQPALSRELMKRLEIKGIDFAYITLHAGLGNFRDIDVEDLTKHKMDSEQMIVNAEAVNTVNRAKDKGKNVCAVGTTVMRAIESAVSTDGHLKEFEGWTNKFIFPPYEFTVANSMISNFHMPLSTLLMIVAAFGGYEQVMDAYHVALKEGYRFGTYGDAMLILDK